MMSGHERIAGSSTAGSAAPIGTERGTARYSRPETGRLLGISERAVRKRITAGTLAAHKEETAWVVLFPATMGAAPAPAAAPEGGTAALDVHEAIAQLRTLLAEERQRADRYREAPTICQGRALQLEERLKALEAGPIAGESSPMAETVTTVTTLQERNHGPQRDGAGVRASETPQRAQGPALRRWWRRLVGAE